MTIESYAFSEAERVRYGRFPVLDTILYRWARKIEETLFDHFRIELYAGCSVVEEMKFSVFHSSLKFARPIYIVELEPLPGQGLFVLDNRFAHICLNGSRARGNGEQLTPANQGRLQQVVQQMMLDLDDCCADVIQVKTQMKKVTTYLFRARILNPYEPCLVAQIHLSGAQASSRLTWCFPRVMLDAALEKFKTRTVVPTLYADRKGGEKAHPAELVDQAVYRLGVMLGTIDLNGAAHGLRVGSVLPLTNDVGGDAIVSVNGSPLLVGSIGRVENSYAVRITGSYAQRARVTRILSDAFQPVRWPDAPAQ